MSNDSLPDIDHIVLPVSKSNLTIYWVIIILVVSAIACLPIIHMDVSVRADGIIRPATERTEIRPVVGGIIEQLNYREGDFVQKDSVILLIRNKVSAPRLRATSFELKQRNDFIYDLGLLTNGSNPDIHTLPLLRSAIYKQQLQRYLYQQKDQEASLNKVQREMKADSSLFSEKVISAREFVSKQTESAKLAASSEAFRNEQVSVWEQQLAAYKSESSQLVTQQLELQDEQQQSAIRAPVSGTLQGMIKHYAGGFIQAGEIFCELSPETAMIAECYLGSQDIGLVKSSQIVRFQVDAFNYNYFGTLNGRVISIDNDFSVINNKPMFRVRCSIDADLLRLKNGYTGMLKKGLTLRARFIVTNRSLLQLMFDNIDDWLSPVRY